MVKVRVDLRAVAVATLAVLSACATTAQPRAPRAPAADLPFGDPGRRDREAPLVLDAITDTGSGALLTPAELAGRLRSARMVFVGESHTNLDSHRAQARLVEALVATGRPVLVGLEMFPRDDQVDQTLRAWSQAGVGAGSDGAGSDEAAFLRESHWYRHWGYPFGYYRDLFLIARRHHLPIFGVNAPHEVITAVRKKGFDGLTPEEKAHLPPRVDTASQEHRRLFEAFFGEGDATHGAALPAAVREGMFRAQCAWDAVMAWNASRILEAQGAPDAVMVVLLGSGHVAFGLGAPRQAAAMRVAGVASVITVPVTDEDGRPARVRASYADYLWTIPPEPDLPLFPTLGVSMIDAPGGGGNPTVSMVSPGSAAARAGVQPNDALVALDEVAVPDKETFSRLMADKRWGDAVRITVRRGATTPVLSAVLRRAWPAAR
jgi:uncharacterized iron-regulated protein